ncbi:hypothetical protein DSL72_008194 [Monilinia vaccinii-corymbosi]|uniref:Uncharacterized protein n=1 Tax=Monilinia vaccinii-corymbosi TaxID=61207 RepID=A0A8A3PJZ4_9HELO|nr:hypothetical protein DSL72_008194 [Monilinia vaccinii-corymbosi]
MAIDTGSTIATAHSVLTPPEHDSWLS